MRIQRRYMTLLELIISMTLTIALLTTLSYFYLQVNQINHEMDRTQNESFEKRYIENRFAAILPQTTTSKPSNKNVYFFSGSNSDDLFKSGSENLIFTFDNGVKLNKEMAYHVIGRLYLDKKGNVTLAIWPTKNRWKENEKNPPVSQEILMANVDTLTFAFFTPPNKGTTFQQDPKKPEIKKSLERLPESIRGEWTGEWRREYDQLPAIVKITITRVIEKKKKKEKETLVFAFPLPHTVQPIIYN